MVHVIIIIQVKWFGRIIHDMKIGPLVAYNTSYNIRPGRRVFVLQWYYSSSYIAQLLLLFLHNIYIYFFFFFIHKSTAAGPVVLLSVIIFILG